MEISISVVLSIVSIIVTIGTIYFGFINKLTERITKVEVKNDLFWKALENKLADMLKSPTHLNKDILLEKFKLGLLNQEEMVVLSTILTEEYNVSKSLPLAMLISRLESEIMLPVTLSKMKTIKNRRADASSKNNGGNKC